MKKKKEDFSMSPSTAAEIMAEIERQSIMDKIEEELAKLIAKKENERDPRRN